MNLILFFILSISCFAGPCDQFFVSTDQYIQKVSLAFAKQLPEDSINVIRSLDIDGKANLVSHIESLDEVGKKRLYKTFSEESEIFMRGETASFNRIFIESLSPGFARNAHNNFISFQPSNFNYTFKIPKFKPGVIATAEEIKFREAFKSINNFFDEQEKIFRGMQEFEEEIIARSLRRDAQFLTLDGRSQAMTKQFEMIKVMNELEEAGGFVSDSAGEYTALLLKDKSYSLDEWQTMLSEGKLFNDTTFKNAINPYTLANRTDHGYFTHRIQWHVLMKEMNNNPGRFQGIRPVDLYKKLGDTDFANKMGLASSGDNTLWQHLFDAENTPSYHSPENFREMHELYPSLGAWL
jgi:hypothetical protein